MKTLLIRARWMRVLLTLAVICPLVSALNSAGPAKAARTTMIEMTTSISMSVKAAREFLFMSVRHNRRCMSGGSSK